MLQYLEEFGQYVEITGYRNVTFEKAEKFLKTNRRQNQQNLNVQFFDAQLIATHEHLYFAVLNALQAFKNNTNHSKSPAMETMLYASAKGQIQKAINCLGIKPHTTTLAVAIFGDDPNQIENTLEAISECVCGKPAEKVLELTKSKEGKIRKAFEITNGEVNLIKNGGSKNAIVDLVIEQVALLATKF
jgi:tRNA threonylcarbamoyladenosine modification (KEOPS) complex Cgi121 subunit